MREAVIVSSVRTAVGKATKGTLRTTRPDDLAAVVIKEAVGRAPGLDPKEIEDVILGCAMPEAEQGMNVARIASSARGTAGGIFGHDHQSVLFFGIAGDCAWPRSASWLGKATWLWPAAPNP